jgi:hypothetical protein
MLFCTRICYGLCTSNEVVFMSVSVSEEPQEIIHLMAESTPTVVGVMDCFGHKTKNPTVGLGVPGMRTELNSKGFPSGPGRVSSLVTKPMAF